MSVEDWSHASRAYDGLAPVYDRLTEDYDHGLWLARLLGVCGASGGRVLDLGCGTGKSFAPLLCHGFEISACDISPGMLRIAEGHLNLGERRVFLADMRLLPRCGEFDLVMALDDAVNYVRNPSELLRVFSGVARLLAPRGAFVFDTNTLLTYRTEFAGSHSIVCGSERFRWRGLGSASLRAGECAAAVVERLGVRGAETLGVHRQRHFGADEVQALLSGAGLVAEVVLGQSTGCILDRNADDLFHTKTVYVARHMSATRSGR